jgi:hypothetical protein
MVGEGFEPSKALSRQIYSLLPLAAWVPHRNPHNSPDTAAQPTLRHRADGESRTRNRLITNQVLCQLSYVSTQQHCASQLR